VLDAVVVTYEARSVARRSGLNLFALPTELDAN
jgi:hypothetical protein